MCDHLIRLAHGDDDDDGPCVGGDHGRLGYLRGPKLNGANGACRAHDLHSGVTLGDSACLPQLLPRSLDYHDGCHRVCHRDLPCVPPAMTVLGDDHAGVVTTTVTALDDDVISVLSRRRPRADCKGRCNRGLLSDNPSTSTVHSSRRSMGQPISGLLQGSTRRSHRNNHLGSVELVMVDGVVGQVDKGGHGRDGQKLAYYDVPGVHHLKHAVLKKVDQLLLLFVA